MGGPASRWTVTAIAALATAATATVSACVTTSNEREGDAGAQDAMAEELPSCAGANPPSGRCEAQQPACTHAASCTPGVQMVCNTRWTCGCVAGEWSCSIAPGSGFGCTYCPGYDPAEADGGDTVDAGADGASDG